MSISPEDFHRLEKKVDMIMTAMDLHLLPGFSEAPVPQTAAPTPRGYTPTPPAYFSSNTEMGTAPLLGDLKIDLFKWGLTHHTLAAIEVAITGHLKTRSKIKAIKEVRGITGWGLKKAKEFCDQLPF